MTTFIVIVQDGVGFDASDVTNAMRQEFELHGMPNTEINVSAMQLEDGFDISDLSPLPVVDAA